MTEQEEKFARSCRIYKMNDMEWREFEEDYAKGELKLTDEQLKTIKWNKIKDWSDYVLFHEKTVSDDVDFETGNHITVIDLYYTVNNLPMSGNGYLLVTENIKELTLEEYINRYIQRKYTNNPYVELRKIKQI